MPYPACVASATIRQMRRQQCVQTIIRKLTFQRLKADFLHNHVAVRIAEYFLVDLVSSLVFRVGQLVDRHTRFKRRIFEPAIALLFRKESGAVSDEQALVASTSLINSREIDFIQNSVA